MYIKTIIKQIEDVVTLAKFCGMSPCQILAMNKMTYDEKIYGREVTVKVSLPNLIREVPRHYVVREGRIVLD